MDTQNTILGIFLALIVGVVIGYLGAGYQYSAEINKAKRAFPVQTATNFISGTIQKISGNTLTIQTPPSANPFVSLPATREVTVTGATKILKNEPKDQTVYQQEMAAYQKAIQKSATSTIVAHPPVPVTETAISIADLKAGEMIIVDAGKDISTATSFDAVMITVIGAAAVPPPSGTASSTPPSAK